jgi:hypothetical protein
MNKCGTTVIFGGFSFIGPLLNGNDARGIMRMCNTIENCQKVSRRINLLNHYASVLSHTL